METDKSSRQLPNQPQAKLPRIPKGSRIQKRPLPRRNPASLPSSAASTDADGYRTPGGRAPKCIYVSAQAPFMAVVKRVRKGLDNGPQKTKGLPLTSRVAALDTGADNDGADGNMVRGEVAVVVLGTGRAIEKTLNVAAWFNRQEDCRVSLRTRSLGAVDDIIMPEGEGEGEARGDGDATGDGEDQTRVRKVSCLEVLVRLR